MMTNFLTNLNNFLNRKRLAYAWFTGGALWIAWLLSIVLGPGYMDLANQVIGTDYLQFYAAGMTVRLGDSAKLYDFDYQAKLEMEIVGPELVNFHAFITPPFLAYVFVPLSYLLYPISFALWSIIGLVCLFISIRCLNINQSIKVFLWSLTFFPVFATISFGQNSLLSLLLLTLTFILWRKRALFLAGLITSMALYKPQLVIGIGILWLIGWRRDWKALLGLGCGAASLIVLSIAFMPDASKAYFEFSSSTLSTMLSWDQFPIWHAHTWRAFWYLLFPGHLTAAETLGFIFSLFGLVYFLKFWSIYRTDDSLIFAAMVCFTIWVSPHTMIYDWVIILIPAIILWQSQVHLRNIWKPLYVILWSALLLSGPLTVAQLKLLPVAFQISLPVFGIVLAITYKALILKPNSQSNLSAE